jgi:hypothetical protein
MPQPHACRATSGRERPLRRLLTRGSGINNHTVIELIGYLEIGH